MPKGVYKHKASPAAPRFWAMVSPEPNTGCWLWTGALTDKGYGTLSVKNTTRHAHRYSYELNCGQIPDGLHVCHRCDTPCCVNPRHLFLGTHADNMRDMAVKGRNRKLSQRKLTAAAVLELRAMYLSGGFSQSDLAARFGVDQSAVSLIVRFKCYAT